MEPLASFVGHVENHGTSTGLWFPLPREGEAEGKTLALSPLHLAITSSSFKK